MKNSHVRIEPGLLTASASGAVKNGVTAVCHNLRRATDGAVGLIPAGRPVRVSDTAMTPLHRCNSHDTLLLAAGTTIGALAPGDDTPVIIGELQSPPVTAFDVDGGVTVVTAKGRELVTVGDDGSAVLVGAMPRFPAIGFAAAATAAISVPVEGGALKGEYDSRSTRLDDCDTATLSRRLVGAYRRLVVKASAAGYSLQPVLARYRLLDAAGDTLYLSPLVIVGTDGGFQCAGKVSLRSSDSLMTVDDTSIGGEAFSLAIRAPQVMTGGWYDRVAVLEVEATPPLHPVDMDGDVQAAVEMQAAGGGATVDCYLPGVSSGVAPSLRRVAAMVSSVIARCDSLLTTVARFDRPFSGGLGAHGSLVAVPLAADRQAISIDSVTPVKHRVPTTAERLVDRCRAPHAMIPSAVTVEAGLTLSASPRVDLFDGYRLEEFALATVAGGWNAVVAVTLDDGSRRVVCQSGGDSGCPDMLSPLLVYPDAAATSMTVTLQSSSGAVFSREFRLTRVPEAGLSYCLEPTLKPFRLSAAVGAFTVPAALNTSVDYTGFVVVSESNRPMTARSALRVSRGDICRIVGAMRPGASWNYSYGRFYAFGSDGIHVVAVDSNGKLVSSHRVDPRGVVSPAAVTPVVTGDGAVAAVAGGDLVVVTSGRVATLCRGVGRAMTAWSPAFGELWLLLADGTARVFDCTLTGWHTRDTGVVNGVVSDGRVALLQIDDKGLVDLQREEAGETGNCRWCAVTDVRGRLGSCLSVPRVVAADVSLFASRFSGTVTVAGDHGQGCMERLSRLEVDGALNGSLSWRVVAPSRRRVAVTVEGTMSPDALLTDATLMMLL